MKTLLIHSTKHLSIAVTYACLGIVAAALAFGVWFLNARPDLSIWHSTMLEHQFRLDSEVDDFPAYQALEAKLFEEVESKIYSRTQDLDQPLNRYWHGSFADPDNWPKAWNRSYEWAKPDAEFGVLLLHGMSDSPYALSHFAEHFKGRAHLLGLRLPGHGTIPSGLVELKWQEMARAVELATKHLKLQLGDKPLYVVAFSTGAALALNHELERLAHNSTLSYRGMIFLSPAIGLSPVAAGAKWQDRLGRLLGLEKLSWNSIQTEYDPFKYNSFAVNAGDVVYQLAERNQQLMQAMPQEQLAELADILTFQSVADATVSTPAVVSNLYGRLPSKQHQLVLFDINRQPLSLALVVSDPLTALLPSLSLDAPRFDLTLVQNRQAVPERNQEREPSQNELLKSLDEAEANRYRPGQVVVHQPLGLSWPAGIYSLSHVALPYPASDNLYGTAFVKGSHRVQIGAAATRGERGVLGVSAAEVLRQKWNPFFPYLLARVDSFIQVRQGANATPSNEPAAFAARLESLTEGQAR
ncbi:alpha/beta hydrolase [Shewanella spartinae]|uniref:alpha/beta hydrolase n=1 Tax=Shewanella spartinae TaxID=2864205 RepID=UPI001C657941|nr:alpha/beta fold hydrolase [Shewanella spartinae]QYJ95214.1 alpha/beta fold hydrolase [Shewanella spartinae]